MNERVELFGFFIGRKRHRGELRAIDLAVRAQHLIAVLSDDRGVTRFAGTIEPGDDRVGVDDNAAEAG